MHQQKTEAEYIEEIRKDLNFQNEVQMYRQTRLLPVNGVLIRSQKTSPL